MTASSSTLPSLDTPSQPTSRDASPASPTSTFQNQQPVLSTRFPKTPVRGQNSPFPQTPTLDRAASLLDAPPNVPYSEFLKTWTDSHVARWLTDIKCAAHAPTFRAHDIRGDVLLELDQTTLREMGLASIGDRLRIVNAVKGLRQRCAVRPAFAFEPAPRPRLYVNGEESAHARSGSESSSRLARRLENGRPPPLHLTGAGANGRSNLPRLEREGAGAQGRLPQPTTQPGSRLNLPHPMPAPRTHPPQPPSHAGRPTLGLLQPVGAAPPRIRTPTTAGEVPAYAHSPLPPAPGQTPTGTTPPSGWSAGAGTYGLPSGPRAGKSPARAPNAGAAHNRNMSFAGVNSPMTVAPAGGKGRPSTGGNAAGAAHPYAASQALQAPTAQQILAALSPIAESFTSARQGSSGTPSPPTPFGVPRGGVSHIQAPSLDDLRRKLIKFMLPDEGTCTINAEDCAGGIEVLEKVLKKFGKLGGRGDSQDIMDLVETADGGLSVDGWGVYIDWGQGGGPGKPLTEGELLSICHAPPDNPARERGLTLRRSKGKRTKIAQFFGDGPPLLRAHSPTSPPILPTGDLDRDGNLLSPKSMMSFEEKLKPRNTKRASTISVLSGLGVPHPEKALDPPLSPSASSGRRSPASSKKPNKLRNFFGQRPPSELITNHLAEYFPFTEKKVLERTARHSMMRMSTVGSLENRRNSTVSWNTAAPLPSRFSSSTQGDRSSFYAAREHAESGVSIFTGETTPTFEEPPRMSLSMEDGPAVDLSGDEDAPPRKDSSPHLLPPVNISSESFSESMENLTSNRRMSLAMSMKSSRSKRMSYMTELRSKKDVSDTASLMTVDQITASVESRRQSISVDAGTDSEWTKVGSDEGEDEEDTLPVDEEDPEKDELESPIDSDSESEEDETGQAVTSTGGKWIKGALIGAGSFGKVYLGMDASNGLLMAVKQVELPTGSSTNEERKKSMLSALEREIDLLKDLQHENIVQYLYSSLDDDFLNIFLEYVPGGSVTALLRNYGAFEEQLVKNFVRQILEGLQYLHQRDIIHRDIKGANILVDNKGGIKISDFGISKKVEGTNLLGKRMNRPSLQGSVFWMAPEVVKQTSHTSKADIWSVGCLTVEMLTGEHPWAQLTQMQAIFKIGSSAKPTIPSDISADAQDFLQKTFDLDYDARPSATELLQHPWVTPKKLSASKQNALKLAQAAAALEANT
ncbi:hypothetical protein HWV62_5883 [Athelia sp. TMB]|nr:hypothetical protein HWV62_5883 [Athelia sp. TMB]